MSKKNQKHSNSFRLIAGKWRGKRLSLEANPQLRPTSDRVRETLFNWMSTNIANSKCLDLFAGSGSLGFEALSRGADYCDFVETNQQTAKQITTNTELLNLSPEQARVHIKPALEFLKKSSLQSYDIVFLDPPFRKDILQELLPELGAVCITDTLIYIEIEKESVLSELPHNWSVIREKTAGQVRYHLVLVE